MPSTNVSIPVKSLHDHINEAQRSQPQKARLTLAAARFMREQVLVMRNTNTKQLSSLHYGGYQCREAHGVGGIYSVPLWTVAISGITEKQSPTEMEQRISSYKDAQFNAVIASRNLLHSINKIFVDTLDPAITTGSPADLQKHLDDFLNAIKRFIEPFITFGSMSSPHFDYELLIASGMDAKIGLTYMSYVDDYTRYSTGGRITDVTPGPQNIVYRITFNSVEIIYLKT